MKSGSIYPFANPGVHRRGLPLVVCLGALFLLPGGCSKNNNAGGDGGQVDANLTSDGTIGGSDTTSGCVYQGPELCDGKDNDCNGHVDDNIADSPHCLDVVKAGETLEGAEIIADDDPENPTNRAGITLSHSSTRLRYLWAANHEHNSVSKFNTETHEEEGIYWAGHNPSRTAVDLDGNAWIGGRADGRLTHIIWDTTACPDRNENDTVDTSYVEADGTVVMVNSQAQPLDDECVVYSDIPNPLRTSIRGIAAAPDGTVWIGYTSGGIQSINPKTHELGPFITGVDIPLWKANAEGVLVDTGTTANEAGVYGMVIDSKGLLYIGPTTSASRARLPCYDTVKKEWVAIYERAAKCSYGIAIDGQDRVWTGTHTDCSGVGMFDPIAKKFYTFAVPTDATFAAKATSPVLLVPGGDKGGKAKTVTTGVAVEPATGDVWASFHQHGYTGRLSVNEDDLAASQWTFIGTTKQADGSPIAGVGNDLRGVGFDMAGFAWTLGKGSDRVWKLDPATNERATSLSDGKSIGVGSHYTYSDFTGSTALSFTAPRGYWRHVIEYGDECSTASALHLEAYVPAGSTLSVRLRPLDTDEKDWVPNEDDDDEWFEYPQGANQLTVDLEPYASRLSGTRFEVEVRITRSDDAESRPILHALNLPPEACLH